MFHKKPINGKANLATISIALKGVAKGGAQGAAAPPLSWEVDLFLRIKTKLKKSKRKEK